MVSNNRSRTGPPSGPGLKNLYFAIGCVVVVLIGLLVLRKPRTQADESQPASSPNSQTGPQSSRVTGPRFPRATDVANADTAKPSPEEIVAGKLAQFARNRRALAETMAKRANAKVPAEVAKFFDAMEAGSFEDAQSIFKALVKDRTGSAATPDLAAVWSAVHESFGVAEVVHDWPAQKLLDYGQKILDSLQPGTVYLGGTDAGRFIPTLLNETSGGDQHIVLTQNAFADNSYLDYVRFQYGDKLNLLSGGDSQTAFQTYIQDAQKRALHDQGSPDEQKQLRQGEDVVITDGRVQVSGQVAVMQINERLLQMLMEKNPDASFALEESFPLRSTYSNAVPSGPIMELRGADAQNGFTAEKAAATVDYWSKASTELMSEPETPENLTARKAYAQLVAGQANLLASRDFGAEAEQAYRLAMGISPDNVNAISGLSELLTRQGRNGEAQNLIEDFARKNPTQTSTIGSLRAFLTGR